MAKTLQKAVDDFGRFSVRIKSICDETVSCFQEISQKIPFEATEGETDVLSTAELNEVQGALKKTPSVIFIGDRNCGKSSLLNELLRGSFLPVHENPCTSRIVRIVYSEETFAKLITRDGKVLESKSDFKKAIPKKFAVLSDADREDPTKLKATVKVGLNHELLRSGIELIDSPGRNENEELDNVLDEFLKQGTVPLIVYIIDGNEGLRRTVKIEISNSIIIVLMWNILELFRFSLALVKRTRKFANRNFRIPQVGSQDHASRKKPFFHAYVQTINF